MTKYQRVLGRYNNCPANNEELLKLIEKQWEDFKLKNERYPTSQEIDEDINMVPCKTIQRRIGGIKKCRELLNHKIINYSSGESRSRSAAASMALSIEKEDEIQLFLCDKFGNRPNVCRQEPYMEFNNNIRSDFGVYHQKGHFFIDVFSAKDEWSLVGCINHKQKKITELSISDPIFYVTLGEIISQEMIDRVVEKKKNKLPKNIIIMTEKNFKNKCKTFKGLPTKSPVLQ